MDVLTAFDLYAVSVVSRVVAADDLDYTGLFEYDDEAV